MNAPTPAAAIAEPKVELIPLAAIKPSGTHIQELRRKRFTKEKLGELAANIKQVGGVLSAVLVRPAKADGSVKYELVFGERRWLASKIAGLTLIPASVRPLTDGQVLEAQLSENLEREDLHELEEAEGYEELMQVKKVNADAIADMFGISRSQVYARTKLLALCPEARKAFYDGELDASRALLIARIGHHDTQRQAMKDILQGVRDYGPREPMSYREAHKHIVESYMLQLKQAPFDVKDPNLLPKAGTCEACPKRTGNQRDLFSDVKNTDVCTDPKCFDDKRQAHYAVARKALEAKGKRVIHGNDAKKIFANWDSPSAYSRDQMTGGYVKLDETTYAVRPSRKVGELLGEDYDPILILFKVATQQAIAAAATKKTKERQSKAGRSSPSPRPAAPTQRQAEPDVEALVARRAVELLAAKYKGPLGRTELLFLADVESEAWDNVDDWLLSIFKLPTTGGFNRRLQKLTDKDLARFIVLGSIADQLQGGFGRTHLADAMLKRFKIDPKVLKRELGEEDKKAKAAKSTKPTWPEPMPKVPATKAHFMAKLVPSLQLAAITGGEPLTRTDITKKVWAYIKRNGLQDKKQRRLINVDEKLLPVFGGKKQVSMFEMTKLLTTHQRAPAKASARKKPAAKKAKRK
jgi:ParB/RepB/Spo0J family partition protein